MAKRFSERYAVDPATRRLDGSDYDAFYPQRVISEAFQRLGISKT